MESQVVSKDVAKSTIAQKTPIDDPLSVYYMHHSDNPGVVLVSQVLTGDNYPSWSRFIKIALSVKNKLGFIDGSVPKQVTDDQQLVNSWIRNNNVVVSWILNSVSKEISSSILFEERVIFGLILKKDINKVMVRERDMADLRQDHDSVSTFFMKLKGICEELNDFKPSCSTKECVEFYNTEYAMKFLMGLNESYAVVRGQILLMDPIPTINRIFALVLQEEKQRIVGAERSVNDSSSSMAMTVKDEGAHKRQFKKERPFCTYCKMFAHTMDKCYKLHGFPPGHINRFKAQAGMVDVKQKEQKNRL